MIGEVNETATRPSAGHLAALAPLQTSADQVPAAETYMQAIRVAAPPLYFCNVALPRQRAR